MRFWYLLPALAPFLHAAALPLVFEPNQGQADARVRYLAHGSATTLWLTQDEAVFGSAQSALHMHFEGANRVAAIQPEDALAGRANYFIGNDPSRWRRDIPLFGKVRYRNVYPGTDVVFYGNPHDLEYDLVLQPGADPRRIRVAYTGVKRLRLDANGDLLLTVGSTEVREHKPKIFQGSKSIDGHYVLLGRDRVGFAVAAYDKVQPLTIDPVITYATYLGGSSGDGAAGVAMDPQGNILIAGQTQSSDFPAPKPLYAYQELASTGGPGEAAFVAKINPAASGAASLVWATFFGGTEGDWASAIAVDASGNAYITGTTFSPDYPTKGAFQPQAGSGNITGNQTCGGTINGGGTDTVGICGSAFVAKFNAAGNQLVYSSYLGGEDGDTGTAIAVDAAGNAYVGGQTFSTFFPVRNAYQMHRTGALSGFLSMVAANGASLLYSTYLGGEGKDYVKGLAVDASGKVYAGGLASSAHFPVTQTAYQTSRLGPDYDGFVAKFDPTQTGGASLLYSSYLGGGGGDSYVTAVAADAAGNIYSTGVTSSSAFPVSTGAFQSQSASAGLNAMGYSFTDAFINKLNPAAQGAAQIAYSTFVGGSFYDFAYGIAVDSAGRIAIAGATDTFDFPVTPDAFECCFDGAVGAYRGFVVRADPSKSGHAGLLYSTLVGGITGSDGLSSIAVDSAGNNLAIAGTVTSPEIPLTASAFQSKYKYQGGGIAPGIPGTAFVAHFNLSASGPVIGGIANGASYQTGIIAPGTIFTIGGSGLGPTAGTTLQLDQNGNVASTLSGTQVLVGGYPAPIIYTSATQVNAIAPYEINKLNGAFVQVIYNGTAGSALGVQIAATAPGIFAAANGQGAILNQDGSVNGPSNPAAKGTFVSIFGTGEGVTNPVVPDGHIANETVANLARPVAAVSLTIGGVAVPSTDIAYAGAAPQSVAGLFQLTAKVPATVASGNAAVVMTIGSASSQKGITVAVQ
jgi:uncharacterized protein (TIGR03437 family)